MRFFLTMIAVAASTSILSACAGDRLNKIAGILDPPQAARRDYDLSVAKYRNCLAVSPSKNACEGQRRIMEANERVLSAAVQ